MPAAALVRELAGELGIMGAAGDLVPCGFAESGGEAGGQALVLLLYRLGDWQGEPQALEGGAVGWFTPEEIAALPKPPLDAQLAERLFQFR
jgi:8-oxo-dGTP diphosphatase